MRIGTQGVHVRGVLTVVAVALVAGSAAAGTISANFCSVANVENPPAGVVEALNWNDFTSANGFGGFGSSSAAEYEDGTAAGITVSWGGSGGVSQNTNDSVDRQTEIDDGHDEMMTGYLQASKFGQTGYVPTIDLEVTGIDVAHFGGSYDVLLYFDGNGDVEGPSGVATFTIDDGVNPASTVYGRDGGDQYPLLNDGTDPLSEYVEITSTDALNPTVGNYVKFTGLTGADFTATITGVLNEQGAALNGFQIVPEPTSLLLVAGVLLTLRRR